ncbi:hypothetical protein PS15m_011482 [Mucor circinelloides]
MNPDKLHPGPYVFVQERSEGQKNVGRIHARGSAPEQSEGQRLICMGKHCQIGELDKRNKANFRKSRRQGISEGGKYSFRIGPRSVRTRRKYPSNEQRKEEGDQEQGDKQENGDEEKELQERDEVEEICEETTEMNNEQRLHVLAYKKFAGNKITDMDEHICYSSFGDMMPAKQVLLEAVTSLLKKPLLNEFEVCAIELSLSSIFNKINPAIEEVLYEQLSNQEGPTSTPLELKGISEVTLGLMEEVIAIKDIDEMLSFIYEKKCQMAKQKKRSSEEFIMLNTLERVVENFNLWGSSTNDSELTSIDVLPSCWIFCSMVLT